MIAVVDYRAGNITSVSRALAHLGREAVVTGDPATIERAERIVVPGVGHFAATRAIGDTELGRVLRRRMDEGVCLLGICLGLQWLFESSEEAPQVPGLGALPGRCRPLPEWVKCPHMGWDELQVRGSSRLLRGVPVGAFAYFAHSYCAPVIDETAAVCDYGVCHSAAVERDNLFGVQFHPEKSAETGLTVLENFCSC